MTDTITIPPEAVKALELALLGRPLSARICAAAICAALAAWPGSDQLCAGEIHDKPAIILPLTENTAAET